MALDDLIGVSCLRRFGLTGRGVRVLVVDPAGFDAFHPGLQNVHILSNHEGGDHGTRSVGIVRRLAPDAELWFSLGLTGTESLRMGDVCCVVVQGYQKEPLEWSRGYGDVWCRRLRELSDNGVVCCIPSGNGKMNLDSVPSIYGDTGAIMVGGCAREGRVWDRSACYGSRVDVTAPTGGVPTTLTDGGPGGTAGYGFSSGTSAAVCVVAAVCACLSPLLLADMHRYLLRATRRPGAGCVDAEQALKEFYGYPDYDRDGKVGFGDFLTWGQQPKRTPGFLEFVNCYAGRRRWPDSYGVALAGDGP